MITFLLLKKLLSKNYIIKLMDTRGNDVTLPDNKHFIQINDIKLMIKMKLYVDIVKKSILL